MSSEDISLPRDLDIEETEHEKFKELAEEEIFKQSVAPMKQIFLYAMALGWYNKTRKPLKKRRASIPSSALRDKELWLLYAIAYTETNDINTILKGEDVAKIVEEYANGGIEELYRIIKDPHAVDEPYKRLESRLSIMRDEDE